MPKLEVAACGEAPLKVAWLCLQGLGDSLMVTPAMSRMKELRPSWELHAVTSQQNCYELFVEQPGVTKTHIIRYWSLGKSALIRDLPPLIAEAFDVSLSAYPGVREEYQFLAYAIHAKSRIGHENPARRISFSSLQTTRVALQDAHNVVNNMNLLKPLGLEAEPVPPRYSVPPQWQSRPRRSNSVGFHVGSMTFKGNELKRWPLENYIAVGRALRSRGVELIYVAGPHEEAETAYVRDGVDPAAPIVRGSLREVAEELSRLSLVISGDNGVAHLTAALGTPLIVLYGPTDPARCAPWGPAVTVIRPSNCPPCFDVRDKNFACKKDIDARCVRGDLTIEHVLAATQAVMAASS